MEKDQDSKRERTKAGIPREVYLEIYSLFIISIHSLRMISQQLITEARNLEQKEIYKHETLWAKDKYIHRQYQKWMVYKENISIALLFTMEKSEPNDRRWIPKLYLAFI